MRRINHIKLNIQGVNLKRLIKLLYKNKIDVYELNFISEKNLELTINNKDYKKTKKFLSDYRFSIKSRYGLNNIFTYALKHIGLTLGIVVFLGLLFLNSNFLSKIYILGTSRIDNSQILTYLEQNNIKTFSFFNNIDVEQLETDLESNFNDISLVSVVKKGTNLIINIKEKLYVEDVVSSKDIISEVSGQIVELNIVQGYSKYKVGDSVKKGDVIVNGFTLSGENKVDCKALASIKIKVWYSNSYTFFEEEYKTERTGKVVNNIYYDIFNKRIPIKISKNNFVEFEKETNSQYLFNNFILPIRVYSEKFYEIKKILVKNEFSLQKDDIIEETINKAKELVDDKTLIKDVFTEIQNIENGKVVTSYVETLWEYN